MTDYFQIARRGGAEAVHQLQEVANINIVEERGKSLLHMAVGYKNYIMADALLKLGVDVNIQDSRGQTALHYAAELQDERLTKALLESGAHVDTADNFGNTPIWSATYGSRGSLNILQLILGHASPSAVLKPNNAGVAPIELARQMGIASVLELLSKHAGL